VKKTKGKKANDKNKRQKTKDKRQKTKVKEVLKTRPLFCKKNELYEPRQTSPPLQEQ
jgi:hypothetical protein